MGSEQDVKALILRFTLAPDSSGDEQVGREGTVAGWRAPHHWVTSSLCIAGVNASLSDLEV